MSNNSSADKAKTAWMLAFGDVITLLITFFILVIVLNKGDITRSQKWASAQLDKSYEELRSKTLAFKSLHITRSALGIEIDIEDSKGFKRGGFEPSDALRQELVALASAFNTLSVFKIQENTLPIGIQKTVKKNHLKWRLDVNVAGYTDDDFVDPYSRLKNNWFLSTMRAQQVMAVLYQASGLEASLFSVAGYGQYRPIATNKTLEGKARNRRVEIVIVGTFEQASRPVNKGNTESVRVR